MLRLLCVPSVLLLVTSCASGRGGGNDANRFVDAQPSDEEASTDAQSQPDPETVVDADTASRADASIPPSSSPDAMVGKPDAMVSSPDAMVSAPDAALPNPVAPGALVINEIEVNCPGDDFEEFVEVLNRSSSSVDLRGVDLVHINGASSNAELGRWALSDAMQGDGSTVRSLDAGEILVLAQQGSAVLAALPSDTPRLVHTTPLQNGPDVLQIEDGVGTVIDSVAYESDIAGYGEGRSTQGDLGDDRGLSRCPEGADTNDNSTDFVRALLTPATANTCP